MTNKRIWSATLAIVAVTGAILAFGLWGTDGVKAQNGRLAEQALPGSGAAVTVAPPIEIIAANLPQVSGPANRGVRVKNENFGVSNAQYRSMKLQSSMSALGPQLPVTMRSAPQVSNRTTPGAVISFDGDFQGEANCGGWIPADQALVVGDGPNPVIQAVNECLSVYTVTGTRTLGPVSLQSFFGVAPSVSICDPRGLFDWKNHRFIIVAITCSAPYASKIAVSQGDNPLGGWWIYTLSSIASPGALMDYPRLGQDHSVTYPGSSFPGGIYIAYNLFSAAGFSWISEEWSILPKGPMYAGAGFSYWSFFGQTSGGLLTDSSQPANVWSPYERPRAEFFVTSKNAAFGTCTQPCNGMTVWAVSNPFAFVAGGNSPELTGVVIGTGSSYSLPPDAPQSGGPNTVDTLDNRFTGEATYAHGHIHVAHSLANGTGGTATQIFKVQPFLNATNGARCTTSVGLCPQVTGASIRNESILNYGGTSAAWMAAPQPDLDGNVTTVFNYSTTADFPSIVYISQRVSQPLGSFVDTGIFLASGIGRYTSGRWGDYMAVAPVGVFYEAGNGGATGGNGMFFSGMYSDSTANNRWRTRVGANIFQVAGEAGPTPVGDSGILTTSGTR